MYNTTPYKLIRTGVLLAFLAGSVASCHYKADEQYVDNDSADSGTRRISTTTMRSDSTNMPMDSAATKRADTTQPGSPAASKTHPTSMTTPAPTRRAKFSHGRASVTAPKLYSTAEVAPKFPGGQRGLDNYINKNVKYPQQAIDDDVSGTVHVSFIVDEQGRVTKAKVMDAANVGDGLDQEAPGRAEYADLDTRHRERAEGQDAHGIAHQFPGGKLMSEHKETNAGIAIDTLHIAER
jgi:TonB family protein